MRRICGLAGFLGAVGVIGCLPQICFGDTVVNSDITANTTWNIAGSPYVLARSVSVGSGATLTVAPGTEVRCGAYCIQVGSGGALQGTGAIITGNAIRAGRGRDMASWFRLEQAARPHRHQLFEATAGLLESVGGIRFFHRRPKG